MDKIIVQEKYLLDSTQKYYYVVPDGEFYYVEEENFRDISHNLNELLSKLYEDERRFLVAECIRDDASLMKSIYREGFLPESEDLYDIIRNLNSENLYALILAIRYTYSFNCYLKYMLEDWAYNNNFSEADRKVYKF